MPSRLTKSDAQRSISRIIKSAQKINNLSSKWHSTQLNLMKHKYSLLQMRDVWIDAYMNGDIDQLNFVESSHFFIKRGSRILTKPQQISYIQRHLSEQTWRNFGLYVHDEIMEITQKQQWASFSGTGSMRRDGRILTTFDFLELWLIFDDRWQIAALCYDEKDREGGTTADQPNHA